eukprot:12061412-Prorocentrum_lima.AAC.1
MNRIGRRTVTLRKECSIKRQDSKGSRRGSSVDPCCGELYCSSSSDCVSGLTVVSAFARSVFTASNFAQESGPGATTSWVLLSASAVSLPPALAQPPPPSLKTVGQAGSL